MVERIPLEPSDDHLVQLGRLVMTFSKLEHGVASVAMKLMDAQRDVARMVTSTIPFGRSLDLMSALARHRYASAPEVLERFEDAIKLSGQAEESRNRIIHSYWFFEMSDEGLTGRVARVKPKVRRTTGFTQDRELMTPEGLAEAVQVVTNAEERIHDLYVTLWPPDSSED